MIGKIIKGKSFKDCLAYVLGKHESMVVNANMDGETIDELAVEFEMSRQLRPKLEKTVCHIILRLHPREKLDDESWQEIFDRYLDGMGFTNNQFIAVKQTDQEREHFHLITCQVRLDGSVVSDSWDGMRSQTILRDIEQKFGLTQVSSSWEKSDNCYEIRSQQIPKDIEPKDTEQELSAISCWKSDSFQDASRHLKKIESQIIQEAETGIPTVKKQISVKKAALRNRQEKMNLESRITIRISEQEKNDLIKQADEYQIKFSKFLRLKLIVRGPLRNTQVVSIDWEKYQKLGEIGFQLRKLGTNVNQLAHCANLSMQMGDPMDSQFEKLVEISENIEQTKAIVAEIRTELKDLANSRIET